MGGWEWISCSRGCSRGCSRDLSSHTGMGGFSLSPPVFLSFFLVKNRFIEYRYWLSNVLCSMFYAS